MHAITMEIQSQKQEIAHKEGLILQFLIEFVGLYDEIDILCYAKSS